MPPAARNRSVRVAEVIPAPRRPAPDDIYARYLSFCGSSAPDKLPEVLKA